LPGIYDPITNNRRDVDRQRRHAAIAGSEGDRPRQHGTITDERRGRVRHKINTTGVATTQNGRRQGAGSTGVL